MLVLPIVFRNCSIKKPNVVFIILESFMSKTMTSLKGLPDVAVNMDKFAEEGVLFTNFYANSFRTDRGLVAILSGYPAQPTTSIMKYPRKTENLPSIPRSLKANGYNLQYYYGGDANFTNMRSYLVSTALMILCPTKISPSRRD
jgi:phosphoglycerol transferase MdoB-like AlkP superfamily enzyme